MIVQVDKLTKSFGGRTLFSDASFQINARERYALAVSYTHLTLPTILRV